MIEDFLSKIAKEKRSFDKITSISFEANQYKLANPEKQIINGTIGMFFDEDENPYIFPIIREIYNYIDISKISTYAFLNPTKDFSNGVLNLLLLDEKYKLSCYCFPTGGGLNALHHFIHNFIDEDTDIFCFSPYWGPYENIVGELGFKIKPIPLTFDYGYVINEDIIISTIDKSNKEKIIFLINIPCHNPTGFSPNLEELNIIKNAILELNKRGKKILPFFDLVYIHYSDLDINKLFEVFSDFTFFFNFSISKTLSLYGFRTGALCLYSKDIYDKDIFFEKISYSARAAGGSINHLGYKMVEIFSEKKLIDELQKSWNYVKQTLKTRSKAFIDTLKRTNSIFYRYDEGFFISFKTQKYEIEELDKKLKEKGVFFVPQIDSLRVAISSIPLKKINEFDKILKNL